MFSGRHRRNANDARSYAVDDDFKQLFAREIGSLFQLSFQLTGEANRAERCLTLALENCLSGNTICRDFVRVWARRMIIRNAIHLVLGIDGDTCNATGSELHLCLGEVRKEELSNSIAVSQLTDFDRMVYVICVLEHLSIQDCALFLRRAPKDVNEAVARAIDRMGDQTDMSQAGRRHSGVGIANGCVNSLNGLPTHVVEPNSTVTTVDTRFKGAQSNRLSFCKD